MRKTIREAVVDTKCRDKRKANKRSEHNNTGRYGKLIETLFVLAGSMGFSIPPPARSLDEDQINEVNEWKLS